MNRKFLFYFVFATTIFVTPVHSSMDLEDQFYFPLELLEKKESNPTQPTLLREAIEKAHETKLSPKKPKPQKVKIKPKRKRKLKHKRLDKPEHWMTIYVHGSVQPKITPANVVKMLRDKVGHSKYMYTNKLKRKDPFFRQTQAMQDIGLQKINLEEESTSTAAVILANLSNAFDRTYKHPNYINHYYTYGWSGLVSAKCRDLEANVMWEQIEKELKNYRKNGIEPKIRIIAFSHGPNLVLNLAWTEKEEFIKPTFCVDELICFGLPVQQETDFLVRHPMFKRIYHFYSGSDRIQNLDLFSYTRSFARRKFKGRDDFKIPTKVTQAQIKVTRGKPQTIFHRKKTYRFDPGHIEFWHFGWTSEWFRRNSPIYPIPMVAFSEMLVGYINNLSFPTGDISIDIRPEQEIVIFYDNNNKTKSQIEHFITQQELEYLKNYSSIKRPGTHTVKSYNNRVNQICRKVRKDLKSKNRKQILAELTLESYYT